VIDEASVYQLGDKRAGEGPRVLIMRYWPRGIRRGRIDLWLKDAAPSAALLKAYVHQGLEWEEFERRYRLEIICERPEVLDELRALERQRGHLTLVCHERIPPSEHCHRLTLKAMLDGQGCIVGRPPIARP
jgi:uncharacterized protein YeaO (DUF488 family)